MRRAWRWVGPAVAGVLLLAGCSGAEEKPAEVPTPAPISTSASPTRTANPQTALEKLIVDRYTLYLRTLERVLSTNNPNDAQLREVATGSAFRAVVNSAIQNKSRGVVGRGRIDSAPRLTAVSAEAGTASISDCQNVGSFQTISIKTSHPVSPPTDKFVLVKSQLARVDGKWLVAQQSVEGACGS